MDKTKLDFSKMGNYNIEQMTKFIIIYQQLKAAPGGGELTQLTLFNKINNGSFNKAFDLGRTILSVTDGELPQDKKELEDFIIEYYTYLDNLKNQNDEELNQVNEAINNNPAEKNIALKNKRDVDNNTGEVLPILNGYNTQVNNLETTKTNAELEAKTILNAKQSKCNNRAKCIDIGGKKFTKARALAYKQQQKHKVSALWGGRVLSWIVGGGLIGLAAVSLASMFALPTVLAFAAMVAGSIFGVKTAENLYKNAFGDSLNKHTKKLAECDNVEEDIQQKDEEFNDAQQEYNERQTQIDNEYNENKILLIQEKDAQIQALKKEKTGKIVEVDNKLALNRAKKTTLTAEQTKLADYYTKLANSMSNFATYDSDPSFAFTM